MAPSSENAELQDLMRRVKEGDEAACDELVERYESDLRRVVRRVLDMRVRPLFDSADLTQDVWASWFSHLRYEQTFLGPDQLRAFLRTIARNKTVEVNRQHLDVQKRDVRRVVPLDASEATGINTPPSRDPTPVERLMAEERWERLLAGLPEPHQRFLALLRAGHTPEEIAEALGLSARAVRRLLGHMTERDRVGVG